MNQPLYFRPVGAALVLMAVLAGTYEAAHRLPPQVVASRPPGANMAPDTMAVAGIAPAPAPVPESDLVAKGFYAYLRSVLIPYRELRPLVRPGTPLARMLKARGM